MLTTLHQIVSSEMEEVRLGTELATGQQRQRAYFEFAQAGLLLCLGCKYIMMSGQCARVDMRAWSEH